MATKVELEEENGRLRERCWTLTAVIQSMLDASRHHSEASRHLLDADRAHDDVVRLLMDADRRYEAPDAR